MSFGFTPATTSLLSFQWRVSSEPSWDYLRFYLDGVERFAADLASAGGAGLITPDLTPDSAPEWIAAADRHDLDKVFLVAPSSTDARLASTTAACRGFVYAASTMGVTTSCMSAPFANAAATSGDNGFSVRSTAITSVSS